MNDIGRAAARVRRLSTRTAADHRGCVGLARPRARSVDGGARKRRPPRCGSGEGARQQGVPARHRPVLLPADQGRQDGRSCFGTRHLGVGVAKLPPTVTDQIKKASLVVFETPPGDEDTDNHASTGRPLSAQLGDKGVVEVQVAGRRADGEHARARDAPAVALIGMMMLYETSCRRSIRRSNSWSPMRRFRPAGSRPRRSRTAARGAARPPHAQGDDRWDQGPQADREGVARRSRGVLRRDQTPTGDGRAQQEGAARRRLQRCGESRSSTRSCSTTATGRGSRSSRSCSTRTNVFVVVGSDHLIGPHGVIKTLEGRGFPDRAPQELAAMPPLD